MGRSLCAALPSRIRTPAAHFACILHWDCVLWLSESDLAVCRVLHIDRAVHRPCQVTRIVHAHDKTKPLFIYMAFHSVHGPNEDAFPLIDVNETFAEIVDYDRRVFAGMVSMLDQAVANITEGRDPRPLCPATPVTVTAILLQMLRFAVAAMLDIPAAAAAAASACMWRAGNEKGAGCWCIGCCCTGKHARVAHRGPQRSCSCVPLDPDGSLSLPSSRCAVNRCFARSVPGGGLMG